jgi:hypothetical protein
MLCRDIRKTLTPHQFPSRAQQVAALRFVVFQILPNRIRYLKQNSFNKGRRL